MESLRPNSSNPYYSQRAPISSKTDNRTSDVAQNTLAASSSSEPRASMKGKPNYQPLQPSSGAAAGSHPMPPMSGSFAEPRVSMRGQQAAQQPLQPSFGAVPVIYSQTTAPSEQMPSDVRAPMKRKQ